MRIRVRELRNVLRRLIAENDMSYDDLDDMSEFDESPIDDMDEHDQDAVQNSIHQAFTAGLSVDEVIDIVSAEFPGVPIEMIEDMVDVESEVNIDEPISGPAGFRPSIVQAHVPSIVTRNGGYN